MTRCLTCRYMPWLKDCPHPMTLVMNLMVPANPPTSLVVSWSFPDRKQLDHPTTPWAKLFAKFIDPETPDEWRHSRFKLIPNIPQVRPCLSGSISAGRRRSMQLTGTCPRDSGTRTVCLAMCPIAVQGSWVIKQAVGSTPVILGRKLKQVYFRGPNYMEVDVDISTSSVAATATRMVHGATKSLLVDMAVLLEGHEEVELPEQLLGSFRCGSARKRTHAAKGQGFTLSVLLLQACVPGHHQGPGPGHGAGGPLGGAEQHAGRSLVSSRILALASESIEQCTCNGHVSLAWALQRCLQGSLRRETITCTA